ILFWSVPNPATGEEPTMHPGNPVPMTTASPATLTPERARELVDGFALGWSKGQVDRILFGFGSVAVFIEPPFAEPLSGQEAIRRYWSEVPANQSEITVSTG